MMQRQKGFSLIELLIVVTGEAEAGSAGEQPAEEIAGWRLTPMDWEPIGTGRLPPLGLPNHHLCKPSE